MESFNISKSALESDHTESHAVDNKMADFELVEKGPLSLLSQEKSMSLTLTLLKVTAMGIGLTFRGLIIKYILSFAPKDRPINTLMLVSQVS